MIPNQSIFPYTCLFTFFCNIIMTGFIRIYRIRMAPDLLFSSEHAPQLSITEIAKWPLSLVFSYVQPITQRY